MWYSRIKRFFDGGFWTKAMVWDGVLMKKISEEEYQTITNEEYPADRPEDPAE